MKPNPATKLKVTEAMQVKGYLDIEADNLTLQIQVLWVIQKINGGSLSLPRCGLSWECQILNQKMVQMTDVYVGLTCCQCVLRHVAEVCTYMRIGTACMRTQ